MRAEHRSSRVVWAVLFVLALGGVWAWGQDGPPPAPGSDDAAPSSEAGADKAADKPAATADAADTDEKSIGDRFNDAINQINTVVGTALFFDVSFGALQYEKVDEQGNPVLDDDGKPVMAGPKIPFMVVFLAAGAVFFTFWHGWINIRGFKHAIDVVRGKFQTGDEVGDVPPFRALTSALSATVGLGNIAGVAIAVKTGGPGAIVWMMFLGLFGMTAKFHESTLAQLFRKKNPDGSISGGPMYYLDEGLRQRGMGAFGKVLAIIFAVFCMGGALGGGNMFQANQAYEGFYSQFVAEESLAETKRQEMNEAQLRALLTKKQLEAVKKAEQEWADKSLDEIRAGLPESRLRRIITPKQVENSILAASLRPALTKDALEKARSKEQKDQGTDLETVRRELSPASVVAASTPDDLKVARQTEGFAADEEERGATRRNVSIGFGLIMAAMVAVVVIGGITRIGAATSRIVPTMCLLYVFGCLVIIIANIDQVPSHIGLIFSEAFRFDPKAATGGLIGVLIIGFQRAAFSSEAGLGSSAIAHSAAQTSEPVREGFVASLEPFIDTIIICFMTAMVVLITDAYIAPELVDEATGSAVTLYAFEQTKVTWLAKWFPSVLSVSVVLFAFSTQISWCYYGERAYGYLFGMKTVVLFRLVFVACVFIGAVASLGAVLDFSDLMILSMAFPNILGGIILAKLVKDKAKDYWSRYKSGQMAQKP